MKNAENISIIPRHVAIILDGNGRWAKKRGMPRTFGHSQGCKVVEQTVRDAADLGIEYLTVYAFSTENWKRSEDEVSTLMHLMGIYIQKLRKVAAEKNVRVLMIGEKSRFSPELQKGLDILINETKNNTRMTFIIAINYGARDELTRAVRKICRDQAEGKLGADEITESLIASYLDTAGIPDPDLMIRTSGELRLSNFLLWQLAYSELYVTDVLWPDFTKSELIRAIEAYGKRDRRFGGVKNA